MTNNTHRPVGTKHSGFGGFPMPHEIIKSLIQKFFPKLQRKLTTTITVPRTTTIASTKGDLPPGAKPVPYISFEAVVGRNSAFPLLTEEQLEELGGVEYRALNALLYIVAGVSSGSSLLQEMADNCHEIVPYRDSVGIFRDYRAVYVEVTVASRSNSTTIT